MAVDHNNPQSRNEEILIATIDGNEYDKAPQSRMEELLLELKETIEEGGGGGGTTNYNDLSNQPQIEGHTLIGNKSASDLGLATEDTVEGILDGQTIDSFGDVETALANKQNTLTAGNYISIANDGTINVTQGIGVYDVYSYKFEGRVQSTNYWTDIIKSKNGVQQSSTRYSNTQAATPINIDDRFTLKYGLGTDSKWHVTLLVDSNEHQAGEEITWRYNETKDFTETFNVSQDSSTDLATKGDVNTAIAGKQDTLTFDDTPTDNSNNPVKSNGIYDALALKQNATDNSLETTAKTIVGAINEHEGDISSIKSGFTNLDNEVNGDATTYPYADVITIPDAVPANLADCSVKIEPVQDLHGYDKPWVGGADKNKFATSFNQIDTSYIRCDEFTVDAGDYVFKFKNISSSDIAFWATDTSDITDTTIHIIGAGQTASVNYTVGAGGKVKFSMRYNPTTSGITPADITEVALYKANDVPDTYRPYENICPISGHTEAVVTRARPNMLDGLEQGFYSSNGVKVDDNKQVRSSDYIDVDGSKSYVISTDTTGLKVYVSQYSGKDTTRIIGSNWQSLPYTFTTESNAKYIHIMFKKDNNNDLLPSEVVNPRCDTLSAYGEIKTYTLALGDTIYGGTVDFDSGVMTVDRAYSKGFTRGSVDSTGKLYSLGSIADIKPISSVSDISDLISSMYAVDSMTHIRDASVTPKKLAQYQKTLYIGGYVGDENTLDALLPDLEICYELATPTTIQLTPQQIQLLKGTNTLYASTGDISVTVNGVSGAIGSVQEQVNELAGDVVNIATAVVTKADYRKYRISKNTSSYTISDLSDIFMSLLAVTIPPGYSDAVNGLYVLCRQGNTLLLTPLHETTSTLGLTATLTDGNIVFAWTVTNNYGGSIALIDLYKY